MVKRLIFAVMASALVMVFAGCAGSKRIPYFKNIEEVDLAASRGLYDAKIMPKDMLTITVTGIREADVVAPYNQMASGSSQQSGGSVANQGYLVDNDGNINFPLVGRLHVVGLTKNECEELIKKKIMQDMKETPIVTVRMSSYRVTVMGEVGSPGVIPVSSEKMSVLEALAQAGDLTIYGKRDNVLLIRENELGQKSYQRLNLNDANLINSPYFYLQQNDVLYVQPNKVKAKNSSIGQSTTIWFSLVGIATSLTSLLFNILRD
ncbi:MAG: polysaccharide biosynthesis/export family protein [Prevotella sp.]